MKFTKGGHLQPGSKQMSPFVGRGGQLPPHQAPHFGGSAMNSTGAKRAVGSARAATATKVKAHIRSREQVAEATPPVGNALAMARKSQ